MSNPRQSLENTDVVLAIRKLDDVSDLGVWFHIGFVNYKSWQMSTLQLTCERLADDGQRAHLRLVDIEASDAAFFLEQADEEDSGETLDSVGEQVRNLLHAVHTNLSFEEAYNVSFWKLSQDASAGTPPLEQVLPCYLQAVPLKDCQEQCFWRGLAHEYRALQERVHFFALSPMASIVRPPP